MTDGFKPYNLVASFEDESAARKAVRTLVERGVPERDVRLHDGREEAAEQRAEMQEELDHSVAGPSLFATGPMTKGAVAGTVLFTVIGGLLGLAVGLVWAFLFESTISEVLRVVLPTVTFAFGGATAGFMAGGGAAERAEGFADRSEPFDLARMSAEKGTIVAVHSESQETVDRAAGILRQLDADRVDLVHQSGRPLPPQHESPRPADPPGRWTEGPPTG